MTNRAPTCVVAVAAALALVCLLAPPAAAQDTADGRPATSFAAGAFLPEGGPMPRTADGKPDLSGIWSARSRGAALTNNLEEHPASFLRSGGRSAVVDPSDGKIPYQPWALKERDWRRNPENSWYDPEGHCFLSGTPRQMYVMPYQILQTKDAIVFLHEYVHAVRVVHLDGRKHLPDKIRPWEGDPLGRWDGDILVIETTNHNGKTWLELSGNFVSDALHVLERITPVDSNTMKYTATLTDPKVFTRPWTIGFDIARLDPTEILESACHEDERDQEHLRAVGAKKTGSN